MNSVEPSNATDRPHAAYTRRRILVAGAALVIPATIAKRVFSDRSSTANDPGSRTTNAAPTAAAAVAFPPPTSGPAPLASTAAAGNLVRFDHEVSFGMSDRKVALLQARLAELAFDPGEPDGEFGDATLRAVWAFEKLVLGTKRQDATGIVTPQMWDTMTAGLEVRPLRSGLSGTHVEVYLPEQVAVLFDGDRASLITHISTGEGVEWCDDVVIDNDDGTQTTQAICGRSITPGGVSHFERKVDGWRNAALGRLYKPVYFNYGLAIHGSSNVPNRPASHGCVRIPMHIAEYFPDRVSLGDAVYIFDGRKEPEKYGAPPPIFDWIDPNSTTTTTSPTISTSDTGSATTVSNGHDTGTTTTTTTSPRPATEPSTGAPTETTTN